MNFEYDVAKSTANQLKHGLSLEEAKQLWKVPAVEIEARSIGERRFLRVGRLEGKFYSCIYTFREDIVRLISMRRSRKKEEEIYREKIQDEERLKNEEATEEDQSE
jgi:uncharacterized DUF497 family protein